MCPGVPKQLFSQRTCICGPTTYEGGSMDDVATLCAAKKPHYTLKGWT